MKFDLSFWKNASSKRKRTYTFILIFVVAFVLTVIGSYVPISHQDSQTISGNLNSTLNQEKARGNLTEYIFFNNFEICLLMFVPIVGLVLGLGILFNTGVALGAIAYVQGYPVWAGLLSLVITPVFWLEFTAYSIAIAESIWLTRRLMQRRWLELKNTAILIAICAGILIVGAIVEVWLINMGI
jgi:predicted nucleic acid-binding Zn ribbon protein